MMRKKPKFLTDPDHIKHRLELDKGIDFNLSPIEMLHPMRARTLTISHITPPYALTDESGKALPLPEEMGFMVDESNLKNGTIDLMIF